jgi:hypothetical protein
MKVDVSRNSGPQPEAMLRVMLTDTVHERIALGIGQRRRKERHDLFVRIDGAKRYAVFLAPLTQAQASGGDRFHVQQAPSLRIFGFQRVRGHTTSRPVTDAQSPSVKALEPTCSMARRQAIMPLIVRPRGIVLHVTRWQRMGSAE